LGAALLGAGGAAYLLVGSLVTAFFWGIGGAMVVYALAGMRQYETKKWSFFQDQLNIDDKYRPGTKKRTR